MTERYQIHEVANIFPHMSTEALLKAERIAEVGAVYAIRNDEKAAVKIGWSIDPLRRLTQLQTGSAAQLRLLAVIAANRKTEVGLHEIFSDRRIRGEWFDDTDNGIGDVMMALSAEGF